MKPLKTQLRPYYHTAWRYVVRAMSAEMRRNYLPDWPWLEQFCMVWVCSAPAARPDLITAYLTDPASPYRRAIERAGGVGAAFALVVDPVEVDWSAWQTPENPNPTVGTIVSALIQIGGAVGVRLDT